MSSKHKATLPVGCPSHPEPSEMSNEPLDETRDTLSKLNELCNRVADGDKEALPEIRHLLSKRPDLAWRLFDFAGIAEHGLMDYAFGEGEMSTKAILRRQLQLMRVEIAGENPSPLERLLTERVVATWLEVQTFESLFRQNERKITRTQAEYQHKRLDRAHRRYLSSIKALAQIRKMEPAVQINIAEKQINSSG